MGGERGVQVFLPHSFSAFAPELWQRLCPFRTRAVARWTLLRVPIIARL